MNLTARELRGLLDYDKTTGEFRWRLQHGKMRQGSLAGSCNREGYILIGVSRRRYMAHRLAWLYVYGEWPDAEIDHINGNTGDNRISNLRPATRAQNGANRGRQTNNASGVKGVCWHAQSGKWRAMIRISGKSRHLGLFNDIGAAAAAYARATVNRNGEFARTA